MTTSNTPDHNLMTSITFTVDELEKMLKNAKAGGSVEVVITISKEIMLR